METPAASKRSSQRTAFVNVSFVLCANGPPRFCIIFFFLEGLKGESSKKIDSIRDVGIDKWNWKREILIGIEMSNRLKGGICSLLP